MAGPLQVSCCVPCRRRIAITDNAIELKGVVKSTSPQPRVNMRRPAPRPRNCAAKPRLSILRRSRRSRDVTTSVPSFAGPPELGRTLTWMSVHRTRPNRRTGHPAAPTSRAGRVLTDGCPVDAPRPRRSRSTTSLGRLCLATNPHHIDSPSRLRYTVTRLAVSRNYGRPDTRCLASTRRLATVWMRDGHRWIVLWLSRTAANT